MVIGLLLILSGAVFVHPPFWTFVLVVIGLAMVLTTWVGSRLEGRFAIEWSDAGAGFEMRARFKAAPTAAALTSPPATRGPASEIDDPTIEGEAHTIELNLEELKALIAAVDQADRPGAVDCAEPVGAPDQVARSPLPPHPVPPHRTPKESSHEQHR